MGTIAPPEWDLLLSAAQKNRPDQIRDLIEKQGVDPSHANAVGQSALHIAALWGHVEAVDALLQAGANVKAQNNLTGATPLHMVLQSRKPKDKGAVVDLLLRAGADPGQADQYGSLPADCIPTDSPLAATLQPATPPIFAAMDEGNVERVQEILRNDPESVGTKFRGHSTLGHAMQLLAAAVEDEKSLPKPSKVVRALVDAGCDMNEKLDPEGTAQPALYLVLQLIRQYHHRNEGVPDLEGLALAFKQAGAERTPETDELLHQAARKKELMFARFLIQSMQIDVNARNRQGMTPLHFAARSPHMATVEYLLSVENIDVNAKDNRGKTPLDASRANDRAEIVRILEEFQGQRVDNCQT